MGKFLSVTVALIAVGWSGVAAARDLVVPVPVGYADYPPMVHDIANLGEWGGIYNALIYSDPYPWLGPTTDSFVKPGSADVVMRARQDRPAFSSTTFSGSWVNVMWPWSIFDIPFGADTDVFYVPDLSRVLPESVGLRVVTGVSDTYNMTWFANVHLELRQSGCSPIEILSDMAFRDTAAPRQVVDLSASDLWPYTPVPGEREIGKLRFRGIVRANPYGWTTLDVAAAPIVKNPLVTTVRPMSQGGGSTRPVWSGAPVGEWGSNVYAMQAYDTYVNSLPASPTKAIIIAYEPSYTIMRKGCTLTCYAMGLSALGVDTVNPLGLQNKIEALTDSNGQPRNLLRIDKITLNPSNTQVAYVDGANLSPSKIQQVYGDQVAIESLGGKSMSEAEAAIAGAVALGNPVILRIGKRTTGSTIEDNAHSVLVYGASARDDGGVLLDLIDPARRNGTGSSSYPGDRSREGNKSFGGNAMTLAELNTVQHVSLSNSCILSKSNGAATFSANCAVQVTITDPTGARVVFDTRTGLISSDLPGVSVARLAPDIGEDEEIDDATWQQILASDLPCVLSVPSDLVETVGNFQMDVLGLADSEYSVAACWPGWKGNTNPLDETGYILAGETVSYSYEIPVPIAGDINGDSHVDVEDLQIMAASWGKSRGQGGFNASCDLNSNRSVNVVDLLMLADNWGT